MHEPMDDLDSAKPLKYLFRGFKYPLQKVPVRDHAFLQIDDATRIYYKPYDCESGERGRTVCGLSGRRASSLAFGNGGRNLNP